jgi:hypothetical protein
MWWKLNSLWQHDMNSTHRIGWSTGNAQLVFRRRLVWCQPQYQLSWLRFFVIFLSSSRQIPGQYPDRPQTLPSKPFPNSSSFIYHPDIWHYTISMLKASLYNLQKKWNSNNNFHENCSLKYQRIFISMLVNEMHDEFVSMNIHTALPEHIQLLTAFSM